MNSTPSAQVHNRLSVPSLLT